MYHHDDHTLNIPYAGKDHRKLSTESLLPPGPEEQRERRKLLIIYVHGFQGNERSFRSFPAHIHNLVTTLLADSHVVHSKIYPRYRSKKHITVARDDFSRWLIPHESDTTDVILIGHSMGGLLCAEVVLKPSEDGGGLQHRLLGTINLDVPFLGMHPGVIKAGLASLFSPAPDAPPETTDAGQFYLTTPEPSSSSLASGHNSGSPGEASSNHSSHGPDPNFNPKFKNDVILPVRKGWENALHFINKHSDNLFNNTKSAIKAHVEFAGGMADYSALRARYTRIRSLESPNDAVRKSIVNERFVPPRVRFVNYYTTSTGRPKRPKSPRPKDGISASRDASPVPSPTPQDKTATTTPPTDGVGKSTSFSNPSSSATSPRVSGQGPNSEHIIGKEVEMLSLNDSPQGQRAETRTSSAVANVPTIGTVRTPTMDQRLAMEATVPEGFRPSASRKSSQETPLESPTPSTPSEQDLCRLTTTASSITTSSAQPEDPRKPKKDRMFCALPPKDSQGNRDPAWVRVLMKDVDEIAAHCGLFVETCPAYPSLLNDVSERIKEWVQDAESERVARELEGQ